MCAIRYTTVLHCISAAFKFALKMDGRKYKMSEKKIKILENGPYEVTGGVPIKEKIITAEGHVNEWKDARTFPVEEEVHLCRCGRSKNAPFCDGSHIEAGFDGTETASKEKYAERAGWQDGEGISLLDDDRCAFARFCHREHGDVWTLTDKSGNPQLREEAIEGACACPAGRLTSVDKDGTLIEPKLEQEIVIIQDPQKGVSAGLFVKGGIPLQGADGKMYETRNRYTLCRCGESQNKPFCDASHVPAEYDDHMKH